MRNKIISAAILLGTLTLCGFDDGGCDSTSTGDKQQVARQQTLTDNAQAQVGMPGMNNFTERKIMRRLYEMRDQNVVTFTYMVDMQGKLHHVCDSMGYGLPYGTQFTAPERPAYTYETHENGNISLPQAEPNALYMPPTAEGTWVICASTKGEFTPMYVEPRVIVSPFRLRSDDDYALPDNNNDALTKKELHSTYVPAIK